MTVKSQTDDKKIVADIDMPDRSTPRVLCVRFRHPDGQVIKSVQVNGKKNREFDNTKEWVQIKNPTEDQYTIEVSY